VSRALAACRKELAETRAVLEDLMEERAGLLVLGEFDTRNFSFRVVAPTRELCRVAMREAWVRHARQTGADTDYFNTDDDDMNFTDLRLGAVYRDGREI